MKKSLILVSKLANIKIILIMFGLFLGISVSVNVFLAPDFKYLTQSFSYTPEKAYTILSDIGQKGRDIHLKVFISDIIMVILYTMFLIGANYATFGKFIKNCVLISVITFLPVLLALVQIGEIIGLTVIIVDFPNRLTALAQVTNVLTIIKFVLTAICFILPLIGLGGIIIKNIKNKMVAV